jgi:hypothetical protein
MLTSVPGALVKDKKKVIFVLKTTFFILIKNRLHKLQYIRTLFSYLTSVPGALVNIFFFFWQ